MWWWFQGSSDRPRSPHADKQGIIAEGSIRSSKTIDFICGFCLWSAAYFKGQNFAICGKTFPALNRNVINELKKILNTWGWEWTEHRDPMMGPYLQFGGNKYFLFEFNNIQSKTKIQGITLAGLMIDEAALAGEDFISMAISRLSISGAKYWMNCNPDNPLHYVKLEFIDKAARKDLLHLHFMMEDNLSLTQERIDFYKSQYSGVFYKRYILGEWVAAEGLIYDFFDESSHACDIPPQEEIRNIVISCDYGTTNPTVFVAIGYNRNKTKIWVLDEYYYSSADHGGRQKTDSEYTEDMKNFVSKIKKQYGNNLNAIIIDPSAASFKLELRRSNIGVSIIDADNSVLDGIRTVSKQMKNGILKICRNCTYGIKEMYGYMWDKKATEKGEDKPMKEQDHFCDAFRYGIMYICGKGHVDYSAIKY